MVREIILGPWQASPIRVLIESKVQVEGVGDSWGIMLNPR
jgi:hypothetical protein